MGLTEHSVSEQGQRCVTERLTLGRGTTPGSNRDVLASNSSSPSQQIKTVRWEYRYGIYTEEIEKSDEKEIGTKKETMDAAPFRSVQRDLQAATDPQLHADGQYLRARLSE